jgi:hypothetical protein
MTSFLYRARSFTHALPIAALLFGALFALGACQSEGPNVGVTVGDIEGDPSTYIGQRVTVSGDIDDVYASSFTIGGRGFGGELLIIVPPDAQLSGSHSNDQPYADDDIVQVTGTVREYIIADIESEFGLGLDPEIEYEEQEPAVVAESIAITPRTGGSGGAAGGMSGNGMNENGMGGQMRDISGQMRDAQGETPAATDLMVVIPALSQYAGRQMDLNSVEVREIISDSTFWVGPTGESDSSERLFVFLNEHTTPGTPTEGRYDISQGQTLSLQGSLRRLPSMEQVSQRLNLSGETRSQLQNQQHYLWAQRASGVEPNQQGGSM